MYFIEFRINMNSQLPIAFKISITNKVEPFLLLNKYNANKKEFLIRGIFNNETKAFMSLCTVLLLWLRHYKIVVIFSSISNRVLNHLSYNLHFKIYLTPFLSHLPKKRRVEMRKVHVLLELWAFFWFSGKRLAKSRGIIPPNFSS